MVYGSSCAQLRGSVNNALKQETRTLKTPFKTNNIDAHIDELLDDALEATFPASDPIALTAPRRRELARPEKAFYSED
jgi:hypothetical protein